MDNWINLIPILILAAACLFIMLTEGWLKVMLGYVIIYVSSFSVIVQYWSFSFSLVKLLTGLMSLVVLGISISKYNPIPIRKTTAQRVFGLVALIMVFIIIAFMVYRISNYLSIALEIVLSSLIIIIFGVLQLGIVHELYKTILAILIIFFGFELIFSANESSLLVNGLITLVTLLIALIGSYMMVNVFESSEE